MMLSRFAALGGAGGDPSFSSVSLLLHGDGTNGSTTITDSSASAKTVTAFGATQISTAQSKFGGAAISFSGATSSKATIPSNTDLEPGSGDFTIEFWVYPTATPGTAGFLIYRANSSGYPSFSLSLRPSNKIEAYFCVNNTATIPSVMTSVAAAPNNTWTHVALTKAGLVERLFIGGTLDTTVTAGSHPPTGLSTVTTMGSDGTFPFAGYVDDLRITKGVARYTASFTPPTAAFPNS